MTTYYVDTSALLKRVVMETDSSVVRTFLRERDAAGDLLTASSLAWLEVWRSLRRAAVADVESTTELALSGVAEFPLSATVLVRARRVGNDALRSLDAIHLASAIGCGADSLMTYDERLAAAAADVGLSVAAPS